MPAQMKLIRSEIVQTQTGPQWVHDTYAATGLTASGANTVPFPWALVRVPFRVVLTPVGNGAAGALVSLDTSQGAADPSGSFAGGKLGVDQNSLYLYIGAATQCMVTVEY